MRSPYSANASIRPQRAKEPETQEEYAAVVKEKCIAFAKVNNALIAFYGRVVDQDGKPLQGVAVDFYVTSIPLTSVVWGPDETTNGLCTTDQNGLFTIEGKRGVSFGVSSFKKVGYRESGYYEQGHARYEPYGSQRHIPNSKKAVEFMLIRDDLPKAQESYDKRLRLNWNAEEMSVDLGSMIGKLEFSASRTGRNSNDTMVKFGWEVKMRALGFTMTKIPNENEKMAPVEGYVTDGRVGFSADDKIWAPQSEVSYAIRTSSGAYGLMNLSIYGDGEDGGMSGSVTIYLNKSGARNIDHK